MTNLRKDLGEVDKSFIRSGRFIFKPESHPGNYVQSTKFCVFVWNNHYIL
jgi:hypothetical protein